MRPRRYRLRLYVAAARALRVLTAISDWEFPQMYPHAGKHNRT